jgi:uncharacterized phiE125 gp8 family phage protein
VPNHRRVTGPTLEPVTLAEAKSHSRIDSSADDADVAAYLITARESVERACSLAMMSQTWDLLIDNTWPKVVDPKSLCAELRIEVPLAPLISVASITYVDTSGSTQTLASNQYRVLRTGLHNTRGVIVPAFGVSWPSVRWQLEAITVRFVAGFGTNPGDVPQPIRHAITLLAAHYFENREPVNVGNIVTPIPMSVAALLSDYVVGGSPEALGG